MEFALALRSPAVLRQLDSRRIGGRRLDGEIPPIWKAKGVRTAIKKSMAVTAAAASREALDGLSDQLKAIASLKKDFAANRRQIRSAFVDTQQQLDHLFFKMAPTDVQMEEGYVVNSRGFEIFSKKWFPRSADFIKGAVFFCHGYGDTCTFFFEGVAKRIASAGYTVYAMDYPGFGLSEGLHGYIPSFDEIVDDVIEHYTSIKGRPEARELPHFLFGQSMGGAVALKAHLRQPLDWDGVILVAPMCKIADDVIPPAAVLKLLPLISRVIPKVQFFPQVDLAELAFREPNKRKMAYYNMIAYSGNMRLKTAVELLKTTREIESQVEKVCAPLLVLHGSADKVTDPMVSKFLYEKARSKDKSLKLYEGGYHAILEGEPDDRILDVMTDIISWLDCHSSIKS